MLIKNNAYSGRSAPYRAEKGFVITKGMTAEVMEENGEWKLNLSVPCDVLDMRLSPITTERLGTPRITEEAYENPDGTPIDFTIDINGEKREDIIIPGPFAKLKKEQTVTIWKS